MMSAEQDQGFVIRDRRGQAGQDDSSSSCKEDPISNPSGGASNPSETKVPGDAAAPVTFASFVVSLGTSALMLMGEQLDPQQQRVPVNLPQAKEIIDLLSMLEQKTRGNLSQEEQGVLGEMLYALRLKYVDLVSGAQGARTP